MQSPCIIPMATLALAVARFLGFASAAATDPPTGQPANWPAGDRWKQAAHLMNREAVDEGRLSGTGSAHGLLADGALPSTSDRGRIL
ncbi:hypothetical protein ABTZ03_31445 [Kitasatospora sp. NPDC096077]|uniref:hypothetical protein n=1 Tax=Kitasatospora sp. NPDC096077 TaxID=3155544 RepID=UPI0033191651